MDHLDKISEELNDHHIDPDEHLHYAGELLKHSRNVVKALAKDQDASPYVLQALEVAHLLSKHVNHHIEPEEQHEEPAPEVKKLPWAVISHNSAEIAKPFFPMRKLNESVELEEEYNILATFESLEEAREYSESLTEGNAVLGMDWVSKIISYHFINEKE